LQIQAAQLASAGRNPRSASATAPDRGKAVCPARNHPMLLILTPHAGSIARSVDEPGAVIPHAGIARGPPGNGRSYLKAEEHLPFMQVDGRFSQP
jgi:hypothetical protein